MSPRKQKREDKFRKVRAFVEHILQECLHLSRYEKVAVDEPMVPFAGAALAKQYRMTKKWTICVLFHFLDLILTNCWLLYRRKRVMAEDKKKDILKFLQFRVEVAHTMISEDHIETDDDGGDDDQPPAKRSKTISLTPNRKRSGYFPKMMDLKNAMRCR
ncbi:hypothetical protein HELRODRAFT_160305 [Helobdella robusta]|uniref:PiggyBac transposable element-derived protein domain-containing protein n=1 Tax=Helobdella robusta TaxID=6412 RepID=T1EQ28_HELRO|nr:hypothetical protein HELRODRAFT_160305 [Helobdella robusta]ESO06157.1 hypothetical protein HELRODRAFT_160305 [Helobdella robusta]